ncbi:hypothetical protein [Paraburkholderia dilworthii]|uniref:Ankyrin repeat-containing protein n=1 Tax=Paraburkholderia dilworthii TaxID=948106 RepID=A0ABW9D7Z4_9BURK
MSTTTLANMAMPTAPDDENSAVHSSVVGPGDDYVEGALNHIRQHVWTIVTNLLFKGGFGAVTLMVAVKLMLHGGGAVFASGVFAGVGLLCGHFAWRSARTEYATMIRRVKATVQKAEEWRTPQEELERAVGLNRADLVMRILDTPAADVNRRYDTWRPSLLHLAVGALIDDRWRDPDPAKDREAVSAGVATVQALLNRGAVCGTQNRSGESALAVALEYVGEEGTNVPAELIVLLQHAQAAQDKAQNAEMRAVLKESADMTERRDRERRSEVFRLAATSHDEGVWSHAFHFLTGDDAEEVVLNAHDASGYTALHRATDEYNLDLVRWLARHGAILRQRWNGECDGYDFAGHPVDAEGDWLNFDRPFDEVEDEEQLQALTDAFAAGLVEREGDQLRRAMDNLNKALPARARKRL